MNRKLIVSATGIVALALSAFAFAAKVNINTADTGTLAEGITGVGSELAARIVEWRQQHGPFETVDQLAEVRGIGEKIIEENRENLTVESSSE